jgi:UDP-glucuronate decarboxylase
LFGLHWPTFALTHSLTITATHVGLTLLLYSESNETLNSGSIHRETNRILVTGGAGFIGSHLIDKLMEDKRNEVICVDNMFSGAKSNISKWFGHSRFEFIRHDVCFPLHVEVDQIYHLACPASPVFYQHNGIRTIKTNVVGTLNMCGLANRVGARLLISSTSEVYGDPDVHPQVEEYWGNVNPIGIRSCYDVGKRCSEALVMEYHRVHNLNIRIARIFNTYVCMHWLTNEE